MIHPLLRLALSRPDLLSDWGGAYAGLLAAGLDRDAHRLRRQLLCQFGALTLVAVGLTLAGVAVLLWAALPPDWVTASAGRGPGLYSTALVVCGVPIVCGGALAWLGARAGPGGDTWSLLREQWARDADWLRHARG